MKVATYDYARFGAIGAKISQLSATSVKTEDGQSYFKATLDLDRNYLGNNPQSNRITPGMTVTADLVTGKKTLLRHLIRPVYNALETSFHER